MEESRLFVRANASQFARTYWPTDREREGGGEREGQKKRQCVPEPKPYTLTPKPAGRVAQRREAESQPNIEEHHSSNRLDDAQE